MSAWSSVHEGESCKNKGVFLKVCTQICSHCLVSLNSRSGLNPLVAPIIGGMCDKAGWRDPGLCHNRGKNWRIRGGGGGGILIQKPAAASSRKEKGAAVPATD